jgi:ribosomal protein S9
MSKHTKGPWKWVGTRANPKSRHYLSTPAGEILFTESQLANGEADLIAAAPDLLEALEALLRLYTTECDGLYSGEGAWGEAQAARAAIARAKGQTI